MLEPERFLKTAGKKNEWTFQKITSLRDLESARLPQVQRQSS